MTATIARTVAAMLGGTCGLLWLMCMYIVARSGFSKDAATDPHGFGLIFGTVVGVIAGLLFVIVLPAAFASARRQRVSRICLLTFVGMTVALYATLNVV